MTSEQLLLLAKKAIERVGMKAKDHDMRDGVAIVRLVAPNGAVVGSVHLSPQWVGLSEEAATALVNARVLEAARAAMKEPGARA